MITTKNLLLYLYCVKYRNDWDATFNHIKERLSVPSSVEIEEGNKQFMINHPKFKNVIDITSANYPIILKRRPFPPFVIFEGNGYYYFYNKLNNNTLVKISKEGIENEIL